MDLKKYFVVFKAVFFETVQHTILNELSLNPVTKSKVFADNKLNFARMMISLFIRIENTVGKEKMLVSVTSIFSFSNSFLKPFCWLLDRLKSGLCGRELNPLYSVWFFLPVFSGLLP